MPIYAYKCTHAKCPDWSKAKEVFQRMSEDPMTVCGTCGKPTLLKVLTVPKVGAVVGAGDTTTVTNGEDGLPYRFKSGTVQGQKKELQDLLNRREEKKPDSERKAYTVD